MGNEDKQGESASAKKTNFFRIGSLLPVVALLLSLFSFYTSEMARRDVARIDVIKTEYGLFHQLAQLQLQFPMMEHLFAVSGETYELAVASISAADAGASEQDRAKLQLQERALAHFIFTTYEEAFYLWQQSQGSDQRRIQLAEDDLAYFNRALCNNPRLLWYWDSKKGGRLDRAFGGELRDYYRKNVLEGCATDADPVGPFGSRKGE